MSERTNNRSTRLRNLFVQVLSGKQSISTTNNARLFVEAICDHPDPATCIQKLFASTSGLPALQSSLRADISLAFLNGQLTTLLRYLQAPELKAIYGGQLLCQIILSLVDSPLLWNALVGALRSNELTEDGADGFSWLLLQLVSLPIDNAVNFIPVAGDAQILKRLTESPRYGIRARAHRIKHIVDTITTAKTLDTDGPGGRHDNDFSDIHQISILPTPDELASTSPYLPRTIESSQDEAKPHTLALHTANHFRLLREDMLRDLREEIQLALSPRNKRHRGFCIEHLVVADVTSDDHQPWSLQLRCMKGLPFLQSRHKDQSFRKKFFKDNQKVLKHQSVACLMAGQEVIALASLMRDEDLLAEWPPIICLQLSEAATEKALFRLRTANNVKVVQLNTAVFSYEPVLRQLKEIKELSLEESILHWQSGKNLQTPLYQLSGTLSRIIARLQEDFATDLRYLLGLRRSTKLDRSQALCFIAGLQQRLSLIQGPPGKPP